MELLELLLNNTRLVQFGTGRGEHLLQFLCQTVARQIVEQAEMKKFENDTPSSRSAKRQDSQENETAPPKVRNKNLVFLARKPWLTLRLAGGLREVHTP